MNKFFLNVVAGVLALFAMSTSAQAQNLFAWTPIGCSHSQYVIFGSQNQHVGCTILQTFSTKVYVPSITYKIRECSLYNSAAVPFFNFTLTTGSTITQGIESWVDQERVVTFPLEKVIPPNTALAYNIHADALDYNSGNQYDRYCFQMSIERNGVLSKSPVDGNFPIRHGGRTLVRSKPTVTITPLGATSGRVRTIADDIALLRITAAPTVGLYIKDLFFYAGGHTAAGGVDFQIIDAASNTVVGMGTATGPVVWSSGYWEVSAGQMKEFKVRVNSTNFANDPNIPDGLSFQIANPCDFQWDTSSGNSGGPGLCLEPQVVPIISTVSYE